MSNFIYYEHIEDYEEQVRKAKLCDEKDKEIERLTNELDREKSKVKEYGTRMLKAIEYLESYNTDFKNCKFGEAPISMRELGDLLDILKGEDKE